MTRVDMGVAGEADHQELLRLMADMPMPGFVRVAYRREPDFFRALCVEGVQHQVVVGRDSRTGRVIAMGVRSIKPVYVNGRPANAGYLSGLRLREEYRGGIHVVRGYRKLRELHGDGRARLYLTTMVNANRAARRLTAGRAGLPAYHDIGQLHSLAVAPGQRAPRAPRVRGLVVEPAAPGDLPDVVAFLNEEGPRRQFFPAYAVSDFSPEGGLLRGLAPGDILVARIDARIAGVLAVWDQRAFRRSVVTGYAPWLARGRLLYNGWAALSGLPRLPAAGTTLDGAYLALACVRGDDPRVFAGLLERALRKARGVCSFLVAGMHESDPLLPVLRCLRHIDYPSRLYVACWEDGEEDFRSLDGRVPYVEVGSL